MWLIRRCCGTYSGVNLEFSFLEFNSVKYVMDHVNLLWIPHVDQRCLLNKELLTPWNLVDNLVGFSQVAQDIVVVDIDAHANKKQEVT